MRSTLPVLVAALSSLAGLAIASPARADVSAWAFAGGGALAWKQGTDKLAANGTIAIDVGAGTTPEGRFIFGGLFRIQPIIGHGTDLSVLARFCNHAFQAGDFGVALDAGAYARFWGTKSAGFAGGVTVGLPLGFSLAFQAQAGSDNAVAFGGVAGLDLLRLTVYRQTLLKWWQNRSPMSKPPAASASAPVSLRF